MVNKEQLGRKQTAATRRKLRKANLGSKNPSYDRGQRSYREKINAKPGQHVHHKDGNRANNAKSNLEKFPAKGAGRAKHEKKHLRHLNTKSNGSGRKRKSTKAKAKRLRKA